MSMNCKSIALILLLAGLATSPLQATQKSKSIVLRTTGVGQVTSGPVFVPDAEEFPDGAFRFTGMDVGVGTHIGRFHSVYEWLIGPLPGTTLNLTVGAIKTTVANGDILYWEFRLLSPQQEGPVPFIGELILAWGTGRFEGASGTLQTEGILREDGTWTYDSEGLILQLLPPEVGP
jgi:hypothetical protein